MHWIICVRSVLGKQRSLARHGGYPLGIDHATRSGHTLNQGLANFRLLTDGLPPNADADRSFSQSERTPWQPMTLCN